MTSQLTHKFYALILNVRKTWNFIVRVNFVQYVPVNGVLYSGDEEGECCGGGCGCDKDNC